MIIKVPGSFCCPLGWWAQFGGAELVLLEDVVGGDLDGGGVLAPEENRLLGATGQIAVLGTRHGDELGCDLSEDCLREVRIVEVVQSASDAVGGFDQATVGDDHGAAAGEMRLGDRVGDLAADFALLLATPALGVGLQRAGGAGGVGVGAPNDIGRLGRRGPGSGGWRRRRFPGNLTHWQCPRGGCCSARR
ncbi:hypothetical protein ACIRD3_40230 [Kitasatospora sp. NPDC093550]|uniref:hypothetical protein n=1 Tax=Kitasatospora sp. NPDC093550 TaxID=3364089 RepID=UPI003822FCE9